MSLTSSKREKGYQKRLVRLNSPIPSISPTLKRNIVAKENTNRWSLNMSMSEIPKSFSFKTPKIVRDEARFEEQTVLKIIQNKKNQRKQVEAEKNIFRQNLYLYFSDLKMESKFMKHYYWLEKPVSRLTLMHFCIFVGYTALIALDVIDSMSFSGYYIHIIIGCINYIMVIINFLFTILKISRKYVWFTETLFLITFSMTIMKSMIRFQRQLFSLAAAAIIMSVISLGIKHRFVIQIFLHVITFLAYILSTIMINVYFRDEGSSELPLTFFPFVFFSFLALCFVLIDFLMEIKIRRSFINLMKLKKRREEIEDINKEVKSLLLNILPPFFIDDIIQGRIEKDKFLVKEVEIASVCFSDLVKFTRYAEFVTPLTLISILNKVFSYFDFLTLKFGLEKVSTQGDAFISIGMSNGEEEFEGHVLRQILFGVSMIRMLELLCEKNSWRKLEVRIGITFGKLYLVCLGTLNTGITFDVQGETYKKAQDLQQLASYSSILVEEKIKKCTFSHYNDDQLLVQGDGDSLFHFKQVTINGKEYYSMENDNLIKEKVLDEFITSIVEESQLISMSGKEVEDMKHEYFSKYFLIDKAELNGFGEYKVNMKESFARKIARISKQFALYFGFRKHPYKYEKYKNSVSVINNILFFIFSPISTALYLLFFFSLEKYAFFYTSYYAFTLYITLAMQIIMVFMFILIIRYHVIQQICSTINLFLVMACCVSYIIFFNQMDLPIDLTTDAFQELIQHYSFILINLSILPPYIKLICHPIQFFLMVIYKSVYFSTFDILLSQGITIFIALLYSFFVVLINESFEVFNFQKRNQIQKSENKLKIEQKKIQILILSILPEDILKSLQEYKLKDGEKNETNVEALGGKTFNSSKTFILFVEIINFDNLFKRDVNKAITFMSQLFNTFDNIVRKEVEGCSKIKSTESVYLLIAKRNNHLVNVVKNFVQKSKVEIDKQKELKNIINEDNILGISIGVNFGVICSGVIGSLKYRYDIIGDSVNISSRLCSTGSKVVGMENKVHLLNEIKKYLIGAEYKVCKTGEMFLKGKGKCETSFIEFI